MKEPSLLLVGLLVAGVLGLIIALMWLVGRRKGPTIAASAFAVGILALAGTSALLAKGIYRASHWVESIPPTPFSQRFHPAMVQTIQGENRYLGRGRWGAAVGGELWLYMSIAILGTVALLLGIVSLIRSRGGWMGWVGALLGCLALGAFLLLLPWVLHGLASA